MAEEEFGSTQFTKNMETNGVTDPGMAHSIIA